MTILWNSTHKRWLFLAGGLIFTSCAAAPEEPAVIALPEEPQGPAYQLNEVLGASADDIDALLGAPALVRREGSGEFRRYGLKACSLIVILYPDESIGVPTASHVEATALRAGDDKPDPEMCLAKG